MPDDRRPGGIGSWPVQRNVNILRPWTRLGAVSRETGLVRSSPSAAAIAEPPLTIPHPRSWFQPLPAGREAVVLRIVITSRACSPGLAWWITAAIAETIGVAIEVPCR